MKIKESLVHDKHRTKVIGFIDIGDINNQLGQLQSACLGNGPIYCFTYAGTNGKGNIYQT